MINWRIIKNPLNWVNVAVILGFWVAVAYLIASGMHRANQPFTGASS